eukprot:TRINITY_DN2534_c0_g1_i1.p1 TRINITY_DN2534_c0_g1~~TRINITY_DN2534_c0_g1_i1.p1  ORF type:complete len:193 (+),score=67.97 TRINITY_DN2534_c0_g1_i1:29-580(+)
MHRLLTNPKSFSINTNYSLRSNQCQQIIQNRGIKSADRKIRVVLFEDVQKLGVKGEEVLVNPGRARNHLCKTGIAGYYTTENRLKVPYPSLQSLESKDSAQGEKVNKGVFDSRLLIIKRDQHATGLRQITAENLSEKLWKQFRMEIPSDSITIQTPMTKHGNYVIGVLHKGRVEDFKVKVTHR